MTFFTREHSKINSELYKCACTFNFQIHRVVTPLRANMLTSLHTHKPKQTLMVFDDLECPGFVMKPACWVLLEILSSEEKDATFWSSETELISNIVALSASSGLTASATVTTDRNGING